MSDLVEANEESTALVTVFNKVNVEAALAGVKASVDEFKHDLSTKASRQLTISAASSIATIKSQCEARRKEVVKEWKDKASAVDAVGKILKDGLSKLQKEMRLPVTEWEDKENWRIATIKEKIADIRSAGNGKHDESELAQTLDEMEFTLNGLQCCEVTDEEYQEFKAEAEAALTASIESLTGHIKAEKLGIEQDAKIKKLEEEKVAREKQEHEDKIAREAEQAATAKSKEAEVRAKLEAERLEKEKEAETTRANKAEADAKQAKIDAVESEKRRVEQQAKAKEESDKAAVIAAEKATQDEVNRQQTAQKVIDDEQALRQANLEHRNKIHKAAKEAFITAGLPDEYARKAVLALMREDVPNVRIRY